MVDIDPRIQERRIEIIRARGKRRLRVLLTIVVLGLLSVGGILLSKSSLLDVDEVVVVGADSELEELIVNAANIPESKMYKCLNAVCLKKEDVLFCTF